MGTISPSPDIGLPPSLFNTTTTHVADEYKKAFNTDVPVYALEAYDAVMITADAIQRAGNTDPKAIIAALETTDLNLAHGHIITLSTPAESVADRWQCGCLHVAPVARSGHPGNAVFQGQSELEGCCRGLAPGLSEHAHIPYPLWNDAVTAQRDRFPIGGVRAKSVLHASQFAIAKKNP